MKRAAMAMTMILALVLAGCSGKSNNPKINWLPGINPDLAAGICDQDRTEVCNMFGDLDALYLIASTYMVLEMEQEEAQELIDDLRKYLSPSINSGTLLMKLAGNSAKRKKLTYLAYKLGFDFTAALDSTFIFDEGSIGTLNKYLDKAEFEIQTFG